MALQIGTVVAGKYRIQRLLGEGGMGTVFVAQNERLHKEVALKVLSEAAAGSPEAAERFMREAIAASRVKHPGIVEIYDADVHEGQPWIAMELLHGESLGQRLERGPLPVAEALDVVIETLSVLEPVHAAGIVHRDLKPDNLFLDMQGDGRRVIKVLDFGIAKVHGAELGNTTKTGMAMGTPLFLAPEQARNAKETDARADLYAVGVILFHALTNALPYTAESFGDLVAQMFTEGPRSLASVAPSMPPELCQVIDRCLAVSREQRPASARELRESLSAIRGRLAAPSAVAATMPLDHAPPRAPTMPMQAPASPFGPPPASSQGSYASTPSYASSHGSYGSTPPYESPPAAPYGSTPSYASPYGSPPAPSGSRSLGPWLFAGLGVAALAVSVAVVAGLWLLGGDDPAPPPTVAVAPNVEPREAPPTLAIPAEPVAAPPPVEVAPAEPVPEPTGAEPTLSDADRESRANDCVRDGDNACVIELLAGGHANDASTHSALIEAYRARGQTAQAHAEMRSFIERYPTNRRARMYQQILERSGGTSSRAPSSAPRRPRAPGGRMPSNPF